jgi:ADP-ribosyl-[dinitrogen reductase] hydrolase
MKLDIQNRYQGSLLGLAVGDAIGTTLEFKSPGSFEPIDDMVGGGPFGLKMGQWTDDTSMALCLAESLIERQAFDPADQMERYLRWWRKGYLSSTGACFDIGNTTSTALAHFELTGEPFSGSTDSHSAGNGSIMRLAPVPLFFAENLEEAIRLSGESSRTTHGALEAVDACRFMAGLMVGLVEGRSKDEILSEGFSPVLGLWEKEPLTPRIAEIAAGSFKRRNPPDIRGSGYVVESLEAALWAFYHGASFEEGALLAVNLGDDADTTGAVYGQLAGAYYGVSGIPDRWLEKLAYRSLIEQLADGLCAGRSGKTQVEAQGISPLPFGRSYWVIPGKLMAGYYPGATSRQEAERKLCSLLDVGVRCVVNLVEEDEQGYNDQRLHPYQLLLSTLAAERGVDVTYVRMPIRDVDVPSVATMRIILDLIDAALKRNQITYVHCWGGRGRTGTVVGCYLARHGVAEGEEALKQIDYLRRHEEMAEKGSPNTEEQREMILHWGQGE